MVRQPIHAHASVYGTFGCIRAARCLTTASSPLVTSQCLASVTSACSLCQQHAEPSLTMASLPLVTASMTGLVYSQQRATKLDHGDLCRSTGLPHGDPWTAHVHAALASFLRHWLFRTWVRRSIMRCHGGGTASAQK